jgi:hypothetical protein
MRIVLFAATLAASLFVSSVAHGQWADLGQGLAGTTTPALTGLGPLLPTAGTKIEVTSALPVSTGVLIVGFTNLGAPFKGGVLVPFPNVLAGFPTDGAGAWSVIFSWPIGVPAGFLMYWQAWLPDAGGPAGFSATNALESTAS